MELDGPLTGMESDRKLLAAVMGLVGHSRGDGARQQPIEGYVSAKWKLTEKTDRMILYSFDSHISGGKWQREVTMEPTAQLFCSFFFFLFSLKKMKIQIIYTHTMVLMSAR